LKFNETHQQVVQAVKYQEGGADRDRYVVNDIPVDAAVAAALNININRYNKNAQ
jgi:hypothetical protein